MPELPEVETVCRQLEPEIEGDLAFTGDVPIPGSPGSADLKLPALAAVAFGWENDSFSWAVAPHGRELSVITRHDRTLRVLDQPAQFDHQGRVPVGLRRRFHLCCLAVRLSMPGL